MSETLNVSPGARRFIRLTSDEDNDPRAQIAVFRFPTPEPPPPRLTLPELAKEYEARIMAAYWNGNPVGHPGRALEEISEALAELDLRLQVLEP